jgi:hypothetical protein
MNVPWQGKMAKEYRGSDEGAPRIFAFDVILRPLWRSTG